MVQVTDRSIIQKVDAIVVDYIVYYQDEVVANTENESLLVGAGKYSVDFENAVIGKVINTPFACEIKSPVDTDKYKKGDILKYNITVKSINYFTTYTADDPYILSYYNVDNAQEFEDYCEYRLLFQKTRSSEAEANKKFIANVAEKCKFYFDKDEIAEYSKEVVENYRNIAYLNGATLEQYIEFELKMSEDEFYELCYKEGEAEVAEYLIIGAMAPRLSLNDSDFAVFCSLYGYDKNTNDNVYTRYLFLKENVLMIMKHVYPVGYSRTIQIDETKPYQYEVFDCSKIKDISSAKSETITISDDLKKQFITQFNNIDFRNHSYSNITPLYDIVLSYNGYDCNGFIASGNLAIDTKNGIGTFYMDWRNNDDKKWHYFTLTAKQIEFINQIKAKG